MRGDPRSAPLAIALALAAGCASVDALPALQGSAAAPAQQLGLHPGETMTYEIALAGVQVGEAQLAVGEFGLVEGRRALVVRSRAATAGAAALVKKVVDESTTVIDEAGRPISVETSVENGDKRYRSSTAFAGTVATVTSQREDGTRSTTKIDFGAHALHDAHSAMAQIRGWRPAPGAARTVFVIGGRRLWRVDVTYAGETSIGSAVGNRRAVIFDGRSFRAKRDLTVESSKPGRTFRVWLSDDADRVPLKVTATTEFGDVVMSLTDYARP